MALPDLSLYLVLDPVLCGGADGMVSTAVAAAQGGAGIIQLRAPELEEAGARGLRTSSDPRTCALWRAARRR